MHIAQFPRNFFSLQLFFYIYIYIHALIWIRIQVNTITRLISVNLLKFDKYHFLRKKIKNLLV